MSDIVTTIGKITDKKISRRDFLKTAGASSALAIVGCADSARQNVFPNVKGTEDQIPGVSVWYRSVCSECTAGCGIEVRTREGRAVKIEGNPVHPVNKGGLCAQGQASLQGLYDPDRVREPLKRVKDAHGNEIFQPVSIVEVYEKIATVLVDKSKKKAFITGELSGSMNGLAQDWSRAFGVRYAAYDSTSPIDAVKASELVYGIKGVPFYDIENAEVILNFGADFLETWISPCEYAKGWSKARKGKKPLRVIHIEPRLSLTGGNADSWFNCSPGSELSLALAVLKLILERGARGGGEDVVSRSKDLVSDLNLETVARESGISKEKILLISDYLMRSKASLVFAGGSCTKTEEGISLQIVTALMNVLLGNIGKTINLNKYRTYTSDLPAVKDILTDLDKGEIKLLLVDDSNPVFTLPNSLGVSFAMKKAQLVVSFSSKLDETAKLADYILPSSTSLESWGDSFPYAGVYGLIQPAMTPVFDTKSVGDMLIDIANGVKQPEIVGKVKNYQEYIKQAWTKVHARSNAGIDFEKFWNSSLEKGGYFAPENADRGPAARVDTRSYQVIQKASSKHNSDTHLVLYPFSSIKTFDGRSANRPWLQELPDPITQIVWDSWAEIHPDTAKKLGLVQGDIATVRNNFGEINVPVYVTPYVHRQVIAVPIGNGHTTFGRYAEKIGSANIYGLVSADQVADQVSYVGGHVSVTRGRMKYDLVKADGTTSQMGREIARTKFIDEGEIETHGDHHETHDAHGHEEVKQMYEQRQHPLYRWAMAIDLAACTGCSACVVACYAENNIPTVGKEFFRQGRRMSWLKIDRYYDQGGEEQGSEELTVHFMPMLCQHCDNAPCEPVCPVYATYHGEEGLNTMVYNRCVGTRYCANNCSYKVRRFNWLEYEVPEPLNWQFNPDVVVRSAGVMEKCTFCVQRIAEGKDHAKDLGRLVTDGDIKPACVQSCPTEALAFGNSHDPNSKVSKLMKSSRGYRVLDHHLNTQPAITYLEDIKYKTV